MSTIEEGYIHAKDTPSNINEHIPLLAEYAERCTSIAELGLDKMVTTWAFLKGLRFNKKKKKLLYGMDLLAKPVNYDAVSELAKKNRITMEFVLGNSTKVTLPKVDMLFIDTAHHYAQLTKELELHHERVQKYIVMHNTEIDGKHGEIVRMCYYMDVVKLCADNDFEMADVCKGLQPAIVEFVAKHPEWKVEKHLANNNGLTVLAKQQPDPEV